MGRIIGIDLGTTNSVVAVMEGGEPRIITNEEGGRLTPSVVAFTDETELVGELARRQAVMQPRATIFSIKRFMGRRFQDVQDELGKTPYELVEGNGGDVAVRLPGKVLSPPELSARILQKLKRSAERYLGEEVKEAVITVPAYFNDAQRKATRDAGEIAGLTVRRIINEPTAAALAFGAQKKKNQVIAVYDFGGGTFDISILEVGDGVVEVLSTAGDTQLGGDDIDARVVERLVEQFRSDTGIDASGDPMVLQRLREAAEKAKIELSSMAQTEVNLPFLSADASGPKHLNMRLGRATLELMMHDLVERSLTACRDALTAAKKEPAQIDEVLLVGGSTRIPLVQSKVEAFFGRSPNRSVNPDEVVALGAAVQGAVLGGEIENVLLLDVTPLTLGLQTAGGLMTPVIGRNTTIPTRRSKIFSTVKDNQETVEFHVCQGERSFAADNRSLGRFELSIAPAPRAVPQLEVSFDIDANGILKVTAIDKASAKSAELTISGAGGLSEDEVRRAIDEAAGVAEAESQRRSHIEKRNRLEGLIFSLSRQLREGQEQLPAALFQRCEQALAEASGLEQGEEVSLAVLDAAIEQLSQCFSEAREVLDASRQQAAGPQAGEGSESAAEASREDEES
ncbi:MAG: molecular chaperone DnaK [Myxococcota bacterium]|jgi:molecular chaperone DnaK|nr:molecular chaperone DnaK [Myxococcota bacterium]